MYRIPKGHTPESWRARERVRDRERAERPERRIAKANDQRRARQTSVSRNQRYVVSYLLDHPCADCGEDDPVVLEFDHVCGAKRLAVSQMATSTYGLASIRAEIAKCEVVCANCHRRRTARQFGWHAYLSDTPTP